jgi:hypothetical protein
MGSWFLYRARLVPQTRVIYPSYRLYRLPPSLDLEAARLLCLIM